MTTAIEPDGLSTVSRAVDAADPTVLRMTLLQLEADSRLEGMNLHERSVRGGAMSILKLDEADERYVRDVATRALISGTVSSAARAPAYDLDKLIDLAGDAPGSESTRRLTRAELADFADAPAWNTRPNAEDMADHSVAVIGAGISGLSAASRLHALGFPVTVIDRQKGPGGTWRWNDYPGARVDVPTTVYQFFDEDHQWTRPFARQTEILEYLGSFAERRTSAVAARYGCEVEAARWDATEQKWVITLRYASGGRSQLKARYVVSAAGLFNRARLPDIPGIDRFGGPILHTTGWDGSVDFRGKRVGLIGTGSSGAQLLPMIARHAAEVVVFQRTPNWVMPVSGYDTEYAPEAKWLASHLPGYARWTRHAALRLDRQIEPLQELDPVWIAGGGRINRRNDALADYLTRQVHRHFAGRDDLVRKSLPAYAPTSRRLVVDNGWYETLMQPQVSLVTDPIARIGRNAVRTACGNFAIDVLIVASGFAVEDYLSPVAYRGRDGATTAQSWSSDGARAYLGMTMPGFPNLFMFYGPNGQPRSGGFHAWAGRWADYTVNLIMRSVEAGARSVEVRQSAFDAYNRGMDLAMNDLIWGRDEAGSYYLNRHGRSAVNMPWRAADYFAMIEKPDLDAYDLR